MKAPSGQHASPSCVAGPRVPALPRLALACLACVALASAALAQAPAYPAAPDPAALARVWDAEHVDLPPAPLVTHRDVETRLRAVRDASPGLFSLAEIGRSVESRAIYDLSFGRGRFTVLLWSQMHGDEPTATSALFDLFDYVRRHRAEPAVARMLDALTIHAVPMLNPDGAERFQRRNAQGIDINRDALLLQAPEGRALKALRDRLRADVGFNLHNQSWRTSVGRPPRPASITLLSVAFDEARTVSPGRLLTKRLCAVIRDALEPLAPGRLGRYDDEYEVRAFGDNVTLWGTPVVLIETGPWSLADPDRPPVRLNFVALVSALDALATGRVSAADPARYESLPVNESRLFAMRISGGTIWPGTGVAPFRGDVVVGTTRTVREVNGRREIALTGRIEDLGDMRVYAALEEVDATGLTLAPNFLPSARPGDTVTLPDSALARGQPTIAVGQPAQLLLLRPAAAPGAYVVERVIAVGEAQARSAAAAARTAQAQAGARVVFEKGAQAFPFEDTNSIGLGDLDGDGDLDAVFANMHADASRVWLNDGTGRFADSRQVLTPQGHGVAVADLDGDGDLDVFIPCASSGAGGVERFARSRIYLNEGFGRLGDSGQDLGDGDLSGNAVRLLDVDGDGDLDALVVYYQHPDRLYINDGRGRFSYGGRDLPDGAEPGDLDGDGDADLFVREEGRGYRVLLNDGRGTFRERWAAADTSLRYGFAALGDVDGDGDVDAVVTNGDRQIQRPTRVLLNDGAGRFTDSGQSLPAVRVGRVALGDLDGDGALDIVLTSLGEPFQVWVNDGRGRFSASGFVAAGNESPFGPVLADLDRDGDLDLVIAGFIAGPVEIWWNRRR